MPKQQQRAPKLFPPSFASAWGADLFGLWADMELSYKKGNDRRLTQRLRWIEPGSFLMGSPDYESERPQHRVTLTSGFWLADTCCTHSLWHAVMLLDVSTPGKATRAVQNVSWLEVQEFLRALSAVLPECDVLLPTEAQWEYGYRVGAAGDKPSKSFLPNAWGLYGMPRNGWEWCADGLRRYTADPIVDPIGPMDDPSIPRVTRGGTWVHEAHGIRSADRVSNPTNLRSRDIGFRFILRPRT
jgi:formylglycine-generating enzyme